MLRVFEDKELMDEFGPKREEEGWKESHNDKFNIREI
jgi:hypothetical protein